jgi:hypothetical protein
MSVLQFRDQPGPLQPPLVIPIWSEDFGPIIPTGCSPNLTGTGCSGPLPHFEVKAGDRIYFLVDGKDDIRGDEIRWPPTFTYDEQTNFGERREPWGAPMFEFSQSADFRLAGKPESRWKANANGTVRLTAEIVKQTTPDQVIVSIAGAGMPLAWDATGHIPFERTFPVTKGQEYALAVFSDNPYDPDRVRIVNARITYEGEFCRERGARGDACGLLVCAGPGGVGCHVANDSVILPSNVVSRHVEPVYLGTMYDAGPRTETFVPASGPGTISIAGSAFCPFGGALSGTALIQGVNRLIHKVHLGAGSTDITIPAVPLAPGEQIFFTIVSDTPGALSPCLWNLQIDGVDRSQLVNRRARMPDSSPANDGMSGGYHGWWVGDWRGDVPFDADHENEIKPPIKIDPNLTFMFGMPSSDAVEDLAELPQRRWVLRGADGRVGPGVMQPSRQLPDDGRLVALRSAPGPRSSSST